MAGEVQCETLAVGREVAQGRRQPGGSVSQGDSHQRRRPGPFSLKLNRWGAHSAKKGAYEATTGRKRGRTSREGIFSGDPEACEGSKSAGRGSKKKGGS